MSFSSCTGAGKREAEGRAQRRTSLEDAVVVSLHSTFVLALPRAAQPFSGVFVFPKI